MTKSNTYNDAAIPSFESFRPNQFTLGFDAIESLIRIIEYICYTKSSLNELISEIPEFYMVKKNISCPWELKGSVMRTIINEYRDKKLELLDGIKLYSEKGWVLIAPDADKPIFRLIAESNSGSDAEELCDKYHSYLEELISNS